eukprot:4339306-Alexandrium_andersonii.AAC.1
MASTCWTSWWPRPSGGARPISRPVLVWRAGGGRCRASGRCGRLSSRKRPRARTSRRRWLRGRCSPCVWTARPRRVSPGRGPRACRTRKTV